MDRPPEGNPAEEPTDDDPLASAQTPPAIPRWTAAETTPAETTPAETTPAETTPAETTPAEITKTDLPNSDSFRWRRRARELRSEKTEPAPIDSESFKAGQVEFEDLDPTRRLVFHRFDPKTQGRKHPHFEIESPPQERQEIAAESLIEFPAVDDQVEFDREPAPTVSTVKHRHAPRRTDPIRHGMVMLVTVFAMLAAARFILPGIVEEIRYAQHRGQLRAEFEVAGEGLRNVSLDTLSQAYQMVNAAAGPSVVHIDIHRQTHESVALTDIPGAPSILISDQGSGVIVDADGYVLTNRHVIETSDSISVTLSDGRRVDAIVIGTDEMTDLAVLKVDADNLIPIPWGDSERIRVGSPVWAIGSPFGLDRTVTFGILSGKHRVVRAKDRYQDFMQSDVAVNPGNSGGPLVDSRGTLIGINTAIVGDTYQGVSFAIPSGIAKKIYMRLREKGSVERGWLGVSLAEVPDDLLPTSDHRVRGALISALADRTSGAARAGLKPGDLVVSLDHEKVRDVDHLMQLIGNAMAGTGIKLSVLRENRELEFDVLLSRRPDRPVL